MATPLVPLAIYGWIPFSLMLVASRFDIRKAMIFIFIAAWLFLPIAAFGIPGFPDLTKQSVVSYSALLAVLIFDSKRLVSFRPGWWDLPVLILCASTIATSVNNGLGLYDGLSTCVRSIFDWGAPYFIGRLYLGSFEGLRQLAVGIFIGGLAYAPLCLLEVRLSPQLHLWVYGYFPHSFAQTKRFGGWRPQVFMQHGLQVGLWMFAATLVGIWLWYAGGFRQLRGLPKFFSTPIQLVSSAVAGVFGGRTGSTFMRLAVPILIVTFILVKSTGAWILCIVGLGLLFGGVMLRSSLPVYLVIGAMIFHLSVSLLTNSVHTTQLIDFLRSTPFPEARISSLEFRFDNEELLAAHARERWLLGWGSHNRNRVVNEEGHSITTTDSLWIIFFGQRGAIGLTALYATFFLPVVGIIRRCPAHTWRRPDRAPAIVLAIVLLMYAADCLVNAMLNPVYVLAAGGLSGCAFALKPAATKRRGQPNRRLQPQPSAALVSGRRNRA